MSHFTAFNKNSCLHQIQIFLWLFSFSNLLRKVIFLSISELLSSIVIFWLKREVFRKLPRKCFKTKEKHSLVVCGTFCREKQFLLIFVPFCCFDQKGLFTANPNFPLDLLLFKLVEKKTSDYFWTFFWDIFFYLKDNFSVNFPKNASKQRKA